MMRSPLATAFLLSISIHLGGLVVVSLCSGVLRAPSPPPNLDAAALMMVAALPQPEAAPEPAAVTPANAPEEKEVVEPVTPPTLVEKPVLPKSPPSPQPARVKASPPPKSHQSQPAAPAPTAMANAGKSRPGPPIPLPNEAQGTAGGNVLGSPLDLKPPEQSPRPVEGGEAGAGHLFDRGDVAVVPGSGVAGGGGGRGRGGLGLGEAGSGPHIRGVQPGPGGEGEGVGHAARPVGGYQVIPRYPDSARRQGIDGTVLVKALVTEQGRVAEVAVERSAGHPDLDQAAVEAVSRWRFEPARRGRQPLAVWVLIPVQFSLRR